MALNIVLLEPEIPSNTGNIGRTCVAAGARLHLIEPLGFRLNEKSVKRAGMDYWDRLDVTRYVDYDDFVRKNPGAKIYMATTKAHHVYTEVSYPDGCFIMFGGGYPFPQSGQFRCHRAVRSPAPEAVRGTGKGRAAPQAALAVKENYVDRR